MRLKQHCTDTYRIILTFCLLLLSMAVRAQSLEGLWYIASDKALEKQTFTYNTSTPDQRYYIVPAKDPAQPDLRDAYFSEDYTVSNGDPAKPFLTTYKTNQDVNSAWVIKSDGNGKYYLIHVLTGKYAVYQTTPDCTAKPHRKVIHLETLASPESDTRASYYIENGTTTYTIRPQTLSSGNIYWNPSNGNKDNYNAQGGDCNNAGLIGVYSDANDAGSKWHLETALLAAPTISDLGVGNTVTVTDANGLPNGYNIRYTIDGTDPDANSAVMTGGSYIVSASCTLKAVVERYGIVLTAVASKALVPTSCATPVINFDNVTEMVSISCATANSTIYYTTDGSTPTTSSSEYSGAFSVTTPTTVKAIATHAVLNNSDVATLEITQVATPTIQNNGSNAISITSATTGATIYYTLDGSTPTTASNLYTTPLQENVSGVTIKAIAVKADMIISATGSGAVTLRCATPVITRDGLKFTLSCSMPTDADIYYTLAGGPETAYAGTPISFTTDQLPMTVTAVARHSDYTQSEIATMILRNGTGTASDPYLIHNTTEYTDFVTNVNNGTAASACYRLEADISASGIAAITTTFTGSFDGNAHTITGLTHPLFETVDGGTVKNVTLKGVAISSTADTLGALACISKGYSRIYNCGILPNSADFPNGAHPTVATNGDCAGGLVGSLRDNSRVINCYSYADVSAGNTASGIVGKNTFASNAAETGGKYTNLRTAVVNCLFYGNITGGTNQYGVYGGELITNNAATGISSYNYYSNGSTFTCTSTYGAGEPTAYNCSFPADVRYLTQVEFHRSLLNSNRELCGWWVGSDVAPSTLTTTEVQAIPKDASLIYKWVVDPNLAPYPILKPFGKYASIINGNTGIPWVDRVTANRYEGKQLGTLSVTVRSGAHSTAADEVFTVPITDMDTLHYDFGYRKVQLPYYNTVFGDPEGATWAEKYAGNYTDYVVTGWKITAVDHHGKNTFVADWQDGYNFADRQCTGKDLYDTSGRVFAQGGNYYVPEGVTAITIEAYWGKAIYVRNNEASYDRVNITSGTTGTHFAPAGTRGDNINGANIQTTSIKGALTDANIPTKGTVYDYAIVLTGNVQESVGGSDVTHGTEDTRGFTIMSVDLDFDEEPDYCLEWQLGYQTKRQVIAPIRFDFLPVVELGIASKLHDSKYFFSLGCYRSKGHFEVTETAFIHFGQFEFELKERDEGPIILNGGIYDQYCRGRNEETNQHINYVILGGHIVMPSFTPGAHVGAGGASYQTRHCAVNALGGDFTSFYLTGGYREDVVPYDDNPHCYIDGGRFGTIAAAYKEGIAGDVTWRINHALISEFYGGGVMSQATGNAYKIVKGSIDVVIDSSIVGKYCGGPKFGNMESGKTVTTSATGTIFTQYFGAGNGGTNYIQYTNTDGTGLPVSDWSGTINTNYTPGRYRNSDQGYAADYDIEVINTSTGDYTDGRVVNRSYYYSAQFATTNTGDVTSTLNNCTINTNFYGGGFLGGVSGNVISTLNNCTVMGSVYGAGYSASAGTVTISNRDKVPPVPNTYTGMIKPQSGGTSTTYYWTHDSGTTSSPITTVDGIKYFYTEVPLDNLGTVVGTISLTISGSSIIGTSGDATTGNVFGGGESSAVSGNTEVTLSGETEVLGNVFGGGDQGPVSGNTKVTLKD